MLQTLDPYQEALDAFEQRIEGLTGVSQFKRPAWQRAKLIIEEAIEADEAIRDSNPFTGEPKDLVHVGKELADVLYVVFGSARRFGISLLPVFRVVHASNMSKLDVGASFNTDGKLLKSPNYVAPYPAIKEILDVSASNA